MANKFIRRCATSYVTKQIKKQRYHCRPNRIAKILNNDNSKYYWGSGTKKMYLWLLMYYLKILIVDRIRCPQYFVAFESRNGIYFPMPWIWICLRTCFDQ